MAVDAGAIRELAELLAETGLTEIEIEQGGRACAYRGIAAPGVSYVESRAPAPVAAPVATDAPAPKRDGHAAGTITSPMVGTVYLSPEPGKPLSSMWATR